MSARYSKTLETPLFKGNVSINTGLYIGGNWVKPVDQDSTIDVYNPTDGQFLTRVSAAGPEDIDIAVSAALKAYKTSWGFKCSGSERSRLLLKLADLIDQNVDELAALEALDGGKPFSVGVGGLKWAADNVRYFAGWADKVVGHSTEPNDKKIVYTRREPYGVVGCIVPWNVPCFNAIVKIAPALATGNVVIVKPSEETPLATLKLAELINEAGIPPGVVNIVNGLGATAGAAIAMHHKVSKLAFTGSTLTGRKLMRMAAESNLKPVTLELGGKSPMIIFDDVDLEQAVKWTVYGTFSNAGQICTAGTRIFVQQGIYDAYLKKLAESVQGLGNNSGDPFDSSNQFPPIISKTQFDRVMGYIESGTKDGATVHCGGKRRGTEGFFVEPTIFTDAKPSMKILREEIFGPVVAVMKFETEEEVIEAANDTVYGLAASVFTENLSRAVRVAHSLEAGSAFVNCSSAVDHNAPFGGYKQSGLGRELGEYAISTYTQPKAVHLNYALQL